MPFCTTCGMQVDPMAQFCFRCGQRQPRTLPPAVDFLDGLSDRTACVLCYIPVFGIIPSIVFLAAQRFRRNARVRFDAFQSLYVFVSWLIASVALPSLFYGESHDWMIHLGFTALFKLVVLMCWIYLLVKAAQQQQVRLPLLGDLAARSAAEQM